MPRSKAELRTELDNNIKKLQELIPGFDLTEEQKNIMLSDERIALHQKAAGLKNVLSDDSYKNERSNIAKQYCPNESIHKGFLRNMFHVARDENSQENKDFNKRLFSNLTRDDELGEKARENLFLETLNANFKIDPAKFGKDVPFKEFAEYAMENVDVAGTAMETEHFVGDFGADFVPLDKEKIRAVGNYGSTMGGILRNQVLSMSKESFLTFPAEFMTKEQLNMVFTGVFQNDLFPMEKALQYSDLVRIEMMKAEIPGVVEGYNKYMKSGKQISFEEFKYVRPKKERIMGGIQGRIAAVLQGAEMILERESPIAPEMFDEIKAATAELQEKLQNVGPKTTDAEFKVINELAKKQNKCIYNFISKSGIRNEKDAFAVRLKEILDIHNKNTQFFSLDKVLSDQIKYFRQDNEMVRDFDAHLDELGSIYESFRHRTIYGQNQTLTQDDIYEIRNKIASAVSVADRQLLDAEKLPPNVVEKLTNTKKTLESQIKAMNRAVPGMTIDRALQGRAREIDVSGHKFEVSGNAMSARKRMTISGEDGSRINGYFTEKTGLGKETRKKMLLRALTAQFPDQKEACEFAAEHYINETVGNFDDFASEIQSRLKGEDGLVDLSESLNIFTADRNRKLKEQQGFYYDSLLCEDGAVIEERNIAMSDVATLLGAESILAKSTPLTIYQDGKAIEGCFMETAQGEDVDHIKKGSPFLDLKRDCLDNSPALKQIADMQILDYICGNGDRHGGNMIYQFDDKGKITGIVGIDNDISFPAHDQAFMKAISLQGIRIISESMAKKVNELTPEMLKFTLSDSGLKDAEIDNAIARLNHVKDAMKAVPPRMTVMPDDEFEKHKLKDFFTGDSLFETIDSKFENVYKMTPEQKAKIQNAPDAPQKEDEVLDLFEKIDKVNVAQDNEPLSSLLNALEEAEKNIHFGSAEYQNVKEAVRQLAEANMKLSSDDRFVSKKMFENLGKAYANVENICNKYINRKEKQGKLEASGKTGKRISAVKKVKSYCANKVMSIGLIVNPSPEKSEVAEMKKEADRLTIDNLTPELAGKMIKQMNEISVNKTATDKTRIRAAEQIKVVAKYMQEKHISAQECGLTKEDLTAAQQTIKVGRNLTAKLNNAAQKAADGPVKDKPQNGGPSL